MSNMRNTASVAVALAVAFGLASCGKSPQEGAKHTTVQIETAKRPAPGEIPAPEPSKNTVTVLAPPSAPQLVDKQRVKAEADRAKTEAEIHGLMDRYADNMRRPADKAKYEQQIAQELKTYKRQTLEVYKLQQAAESAKAADPHATTR
jgi:type IV secretory pathway VirB10-like protein